jgi:putative endonuclease
MNGDDTTSRSGQRGENLAARFLEQRGLTLIARNHRCRGGEIDLICQDGKTLVFVEVRLRKSRVFGGAAASITPAKQRRVVLAARHYLASTGKHRTESRFDCVLLDGESIEWIKDAFAAPS